MVYVHKYKNKIDTSTDISYAPNTDYPHVSRYAILRKIKNQKENVSYLETQNARYPEDSSMDQYHVVSPGEENRLDIIAYKYYNDASLYWAIALANNIFDTYTIPVGTSLRIPALATLNNPGQRILLR